MLPGRNDDAARASKKFSKHSVLLTPTSTIDEKVLERSVLPLMKDYLASYAQQEVTQSDGYGAPGQVVMRRSANTAPLPAPRLTPLPRQQLLPCDRGECTILGVASGSPHVAANDGAVQKQRLRCAAKLNTSTDFAKRSTQMLEWTRRYPITSSETSMSVSTWAPLLLREVNKCVAETAPKPDALRVSAALHVAEACFRALSIPMDFFADILSAVSSAHAGQASGDSHVSEVPSTFTFEALRDANIQRKLLKEKTIEALQQKDLVEGELLRNQQERSLRSLKEHFAAWRGVVNSAVWRRAAQLQKQSREEFVWKRITFFSWKSYVSVARSEAQVEVLSLRLDKILEGHRQDLATQSALLRKQMDTERRQFDDALAEARANQITPEERAAQEERAVQLKHLESSNNELKKKLLIVDAQVKEGVMFREQSLAVLRGTVQRVSGALATLINKRMCSGLRAAEIVAEAIRLEVGYDEEPSSPSKCTVTSSSVDIIRIPIRCSAPAVLAAWANMQLRREGAPQRLVTLGPELSDCAIYGVLWKSMDAGSGVPGQLSSTDDIAKRNAILVGELNKWLIQTETGGAMAIPVERRKAMRLLMSTPLSLSQVTPQALIAGDVVAHSMVMMSFFRLYARLFVVPLPNHAVIDPWLKGANDTTSVTNLDDCASALESICSALQIVQKSNFAWTTLTRHVDADMFRIASEAMQESTNDCANKGTPLVVGSNDRRVGRFTVRGSLLRNAPKLICEAPSNSAEVDKEGAPQENVSIPDDVPLEERLSEEDDSVLDLMTQVVPSKLQRDAVLLMMERCSSTLCALFTFYSGNVDRLRCPQFLRLLLDCGVPEPKDVPQVQKETRLTDEGEEPSLSVLGASLIDGGVQTKEKLFDKYSVPSKVGGGKSLTPLGFGALLIELSEAVSLGLPEWKWVLPTQSTPSMRFEMFVYHFLFSRVSKPVFTDLAFRNAHQVPSILLKKSSSQDLLRVELLQGTTAKDATVADTIRNLFENLLQIVRPQAPQPVQSGDFVTLLYDEFLRLWKELDVVDSSFTPNEVKVLFLALSTNEFGVESEAAQQQQQQQAKKGISTKNPPAPVSLLRIDLFDFVDVIGAVSFFKLPSPFFSFQGRIREFVGERLLPTLKRKYPQCVMKV